MKQRLADDISLFAQSPDLDPASVEIAVTIPTFRRPDHVLRTLHSIAAQTTSRKTAIVLIENDAPACQGAEAAAPLFRDGSCQGLVIVAHRRGNCEAYNAGWLTALAMFPNLGAIAVIDDDEVADPGWINGLSTIAETHGCALVGGPQMPAFEPGVRDAWTRHPVFAPHYDTSGPVPALYSSGNLLVRRDVLQAMPQPFMDLSFNFTGGGDADFLSRARQAGFATGWSQAAVVTETIPAARVTRQWITTRALRNGQLSARVARRGRPGLAGRLRTMAHSAALLAASPLRAMARLARDRSVLNALYPIHIAIGRIQAEFGRAHEQYRNPTD